MGIITGLVPILTYSGTPAAQIAAFKALIPNPDTKESPQPRQPGSILDEISPLAAAQLRLEIDTLANGLDLGADGVAYGQYTVVAADDTANLVNIVTGLADTTLAKIAVSISRAGVLVDGGTTGGATITEPVAGTIRVADGGGYVVTTGDIITWFAIDPL